MLKAIQNINWGYILILLGIGAISAGFPWLMKKRSEERSYDLIGVV